MKNFAIGIWIPTAIAAARYNLHACHIEATFQGGDDIVFHVFTRTSCKNLEFGFSAFYVDNGKIGRCLYYVRIDRDEANYAVVTSIDGVYQVVLYFYRNLLFGSFYLNGNKLDVVFYGFKLVFKVFFPIIDKVFHVFNILFRHRENNFSLERNGIAHVSSMPRGQATSFFLDGFANKSDHKFVGIGTAFIDFKPRVATP